MDGIHKIGFPLGGVDILISGNIPVGAGLSSSAALCCGFGMAYSTVMRFELVRLAIAKIAQYAEHNFAGVKCGLMDQYASLFGKKDHALLLDCKTLEHEAVPFQFPDIDILLIDTKVKHSLADSAYNNRREACELGVALVMRKYDVRSLRDVTPDMLMELKDDFPDDIFVIHLEYPRFFINLKDDSVEFLEDIEEEDQTELEAEMEHLITLAGEFYDREMERYEEA